MTISEREFQSMADREQRKRKNHSNAAAGDAQEMQTLREGEDQPTLAVDDESDARRLLRRNYRNMIVDTTDQMEELARNTSAAIIAKVVDANSLYHQVKTTSEATLDAKLLVATSSVGVRQTTNSSQDSSSYDMNEFIARTLAFMDNSQLGAARNNNSNNADDLDWNLLAEAACEFSRAPPAFTFLLGPLAIERKAKKESTGVTVASSQRIDRSEFKPENARKPDELKVDDIQKEENETTQNIKTVYDSLVEAGPTPYWAFIINPQSFSQSVENCFYLAFLAKEGRVVFQEADDGSVKYPDCVIAACEQFSDEERAKLPKRQYMVSFDMKSWRKLIEQYDIKRPLIAHRAPSLQVSGGTNKWYG